MPTSTWVGGDIVSRLVTWSAGPASVAVATKTRSGPVTVATLVGAPLRLTVEATIPRPIDTIERVRSSRLAATAYSPDLSGTVSGAPGASPTGVWDRAPVPAPDEAPAPPARLPPDDEDVEPACDWLLQAVRKASSTMARSM